MAQRSTPQNSTQFCPYWVQTITHVEFCVHQHFANCFAIDLESLKWHWTAIWHSMAHWLPIHWSSPTFRCQKHNLATVQLPTHADGGAAVTVTKQAVMMADDTIARRIKWTSWATSAHYDVGSSCRENDQGMSHFFTDHLTNSCRVFFLYYATSDSKCSAVHAGQINCPQWVASSRIRPLACIHVQIRHL